MKNEHDTATAELPVTAAPETSRPEGLTLVQMYQINVKPQVRTETGWSDAELDELGESIMQQGLLQLPLLRRDTESNTLIPVAGHRRIEAMKRKGFSEFYAIVGDADEAKAFRMQLAENIQREQLSTREVANAVRKLADEGNTPAQIGEIVKKSKAWVSKHLSLTHPEFGKYARRLFESGTVEDLEILGSLSTAEKALIANLHLDPEGWFIEYLENSGKTWTRKNSAAATKKAKAWAPDQEETDADNEDSEEKEEQQGNETPARWTGQAMPTPFLVLEVLEKIECDFSERRDATYKGAFAYLVEQLYTHHRDIQEALTDILGAYAHRADQ